jgi:hypothetical protein
MKILFNILLLSIYLSAFGQTTKTKTHYRTIRTIFTDINNDNKTDTIILSSSLPEQSSFNRITISISGFKKQTFYAKDSWTTVDKWFLDSNRNTVNSKFLFLKKTDKHAVILLFGILDGAGYRGEFSIINIENNNIRMVFDHTENGIYDVEVPSKLIDLEANGRLCFIYTGLHEFDGYDANLNGDIGSYTPYFVFAVNDTCELNKPLTKKYNEDNYVFAGFNYSEKIRILYPRNKMKKPSIYKKKYTIL